MKSAAERRHPNRVRHSARHVMLVVLDGGRDRDRTCDPYRVEVVLYR